MYQEKKFQPILVDLVDGNIAAGSSENPKAVPILERCATLIQLNIDKANGEKKGFNIAKAYTMIQVSASIQVKTSFMSLPLKVTDENGEEHVDIDLSRIGDDWFQVNYNSVMGY